MKIDYKNAVQITPEDFETLKQKKIILTKIVFYLIYGDFYFSWLPSLMNLTEREKGCIKLVYNKNSRILPIMTCYADIGQQFLGVLKLKLAVVISWG